jgi:hypothetical protein
VYKVLDFYPAALIASVRERILGFDGGEYEDGCLLGCSALMLEAACNSEAFLQSSTSLHGATTQKTAIFN